MGDIALWIVGIIFVFVAWILNLITKVRLGSGEIESAKLSQRLATTFTSFGIGWLIGQVINYFMK